MKLQDSLSEGKFVQRTWILCACKPTDSSLDQRVREKKTLLTWLFLEVESGGVEQSKQLAKGEGAAEPFPETGWRHLAQQPLALGSLGKLNACKTAQHLSQSLEGTVLIAVAAKQCIRHACLERKIKSCI